MGKHPPANAWCLIRSNELLRQLLTDVIEEKKYTYKILAEMTGLEANRISDYFTGAKGLTQYGVVKLADTLGIQISLKIEYKYPI